MAIKSTINPESFINSNKGSVDLFRNFFTKKKSFAKTIDPSASNRTVNFQKVNIAPTSLDFNNIINTISTSIDNAVNTEVQVINKSSQNILNQTINNVQAFTQKKLDGIYKNYQEKLGRLDSTKPSNLIEQFLNNYRSAIAFAEFFSSDKNIKKVTKNFSVLKKLFNDSFDIAKIIRKVIVKIVKQLTNLPAASSSGGGGINLDVKIPGGPLKSMGSKVLGKPARMLAAGAGVVGAGMIAGGAVSALSGTEKIKPYSAQTDVTNELLMGLSSVINKFANIVDQLLKGSKDKKKKPSNISPKINSSAKAPPGSNDPGSSTPIAGDASPEIKALMESLTIGESSDYESMNTGPGGSHKLPGATKMTIAEVANRAVGAVGRWQNMPEFLIQRAKDAGLDPYKDLYSPENQAKITRWHLTDVLRKSEKQITEILKTGRSGFIQINSGLVGTWPSRPGGTQQNTTWDQLWRGYEKSRKYHSSQSSVQNTSRLPEVSSTSPTSNSVVASTSSSVRRTGSNSSNVSYIPLTPNVTVVPSSGNSQGATNVAATPSNPSSPTIAWLSPHNPDNIHRLSCAINLGVAV
jgi:hypothetical protein